MEVTGSFDRPRIGHIIGVSGSKATASFLPQINRTNGQHRATVGTFVVLCSGNSILVGVITGVALASSSPESRDAVGQIDIIGEICMPDTVDARFRRGVATYPAIGDPVSFVTSSDIQKIFHPPSSEAIQVGRLQQDSALGAFVNIKDMVTKHFAILGTTGVGKSSAIAILLQEALKARPDLRVLLLDVHNEYGRCFGEKAHTLSPKNIRLPFWLFNFEEIIDIFFAGRSGLEEEIDLLSELIPLAKAAYGQGLSFDRLLIKKNEPGGVRYTTDVPLPYRMSDLLSLLDARMGKLENRFSRMVYHKLILRIEAVCSDPRYAFIFENANVGGDTMAEALSLIFRLPPNGVPITIMQLAGFPAEVVDAVVSVLCRMAFDLGLWSEGADPLLVICEEAHRYMAADHTVGFGPTRRAVSRIAKEGRKYGVFLGLVTQRPAELDPTILSQCSTLFAMRMTNERDQALLQSAVSDSSANLLAFLPSLGMGEAFAFGEGVAVPLRLRFTELPEDAVPSSKAGWGHAVKTEEPSSLAAVIERWRGVAARGKGTVIKAEEQKPQRGSGTAGDAAVMHRMSQLR